MRADGRRGARNGCFRRRGSDALARHRRGPTSQPPLAATTGAHRGGRCAHRGAGGVRPPQRSRPGGRRRGQHQQRLRGDLLQDRREPVHQRRLSTQRERGPGGWVRTCPGALALRRQVADAGWSGAWIWRRRSPSCAPGAARSRRSSRMSGPATCSTRRVGSVNASAGRARGLRARRRPRRAAHRTLASAGCSDGAVPSRIDRVQVRQQNSGASRSPQLCVKAGARVTGQHRLAGVGAAGRQQVTGSPEPGKMTCSWCRPTSPRQGR